MHCNIMEPQCDEAGSSLFFDCMQEQLNHTRLVVPIHHNYKYFHTREKKYKAGNYK